MLNVFTTDKVSCGVKIKKISPLRVKITTKNPKNMNINIFFKKLFSYKSQIVKIVFGICLYRNMKLLSPIFVNCILAKAVCHLYIHFFSFFAVSYTFLSYFSFFLPWLVAVVLFGSYLHCVLPLGSVVMKNWPVHPWGHCRGLSGLR